MKRQVIIIHGGDVFETYREYLSDLKREKLDIAEITGPKAGKWKETMAEQLGTSYEVIYPEMPSNWWNCKYVEWKVWFEKLIPFTRDGALFVGHSLGGIFLARYFSENLFPKKVRAIFLVAAPYKKRKLGKPNYFGSFFLKNDLSLMTRQAKGVYLYHSKDDPVATFSYLKKYQENLPEAHSVVMNGKGHFSQERFPELIKAIKSLS